MAAFSHPKLNTETLRTAIQRTLGIAPRRSKQPQLAYRAEFGNDPGKQAQWRAFLKRSALTQAPGNLAEVVEELRGFFEPILGAFA